MIYEQMLKEQKRLEKEIEYIQTELHKLPPGNLVCSRNTNRYKWYISNGHTKEYIPKKERHLAEQLAAKKYYTLLQNDLLLGKKAIDSYLKHYNVTTNQSFKLLTEESEYQRLLAPYFKPISQELSDWMNSTYDKNPKYPEQLIHKTLSGHYVRSKSESIIAMLLYTNKIPFRYECALELDTSIIYPDFTIRHPVTKETYYWEHFGRMDDPVYYKKVYPKLLLYNSHNIIPSINLITTYETKDNPLTIDTIERIITEYFL